MFHSLWPAVLIFCLRSIDVSLGTLRLILTVQGRRLLAALIGLIEVSIFITAVAKVVQGPLDPLRVLGYGGGFAAGTYLGMTLDRKLGLGDAVVRIITCAHRPMVQALTEAGFGLTLLEGRGGRGSNVGVIFSVCHRKRLSEIMRLVCEVDSGATVTVEEVRQRLHGYFAPRPSSSAAMGRIRQALGLA